MVDNKLLRNLFFLGLFGVAFVCSLLWLSYQYTPTILIYHSVSDDGSENSVSIKTFEKQLAYLKKKNYNVVSLDSLVSRIEQERKFNRKTVVITFDGGDESLYANAFPLLQEYKFPFTFFVPADFVNQEGYLSYSQVKEILRERAHLGSQAMKQEYLPDLNPRKARNTIQESRWILEKNFETDVDFFAYPSGGFNESLKSVVQNTGYVAAVTTDRGRDRLNKDVYELNRVKVTDRDRSGIQLWGKLSGYFNFFRFGKPSS